jgi:lysophospholipase L1-like esterase
MVAALFLVMSSRTFSQLDDTSVNKVRFLALGDSYTIGEAVPRSDSWPVQLVGRLRERGVSSDDPLVVARTGWTTDELLAGIAEANPQGVFDLVSLLIGVNNQYRGRDTAEYREEFKALLRKALEFADERPEAAVVLSIPDWGVTPFAEGRDREAISASIDEFNAINRDESLRAGVHYVDVTEISRKAGEDRSLLADDGLHPSARMYELWTMAVLAEMFPE